MYILKRWHYYRQTGFLKENGYYSIKYQEKKDLILLAAKTEKIPDATNAKQYYYTFLKNKNKKSVKRLKILTQQPKP